MHILLTGGTGFIGSALVPHLAARGHTLTVLSRSAHEDTDSCRYIRDLDVIADDEQIDAVINLAGASLAGARWTPAYKREIVESRLATTRRLIDRMQQLQMPPQVLLNASAIGYYGHGDEPMTEDAGAGDGFSADLCASSGRTPRVRSSHSEPVSACAASASSWMQVVAPLRSCTGRSVSVWPTGSAAVGSG